MGQSGLVSGAVTHLHRSADHAFTKSSEPTLELVAGMGVQGDVHFGATVQHRSRVATDSTQPNLRQVHLIHAELFDELLRDGFPVQPGDLGENITSRNLELLALPVGAVLRIGDALLAVTGLRNPCLQIEHFQTGLLKRVTDNRGSGHHMAGVMAVVLRGGWISIGDAIEYSLPPGEPVALTRV